MENVKERAIETVLGEVEKQLGKGPIMRLGVAGGAEAPATTTHPVGKVA